MKYSMSIVFIMLAFSSVGQSIDFSDAERAAKNYFSFVSGNNNELEILNSYTKEFNNHHSWYAFNFDTSGFVIISGHESAGPILGYSLDCSIDINNSSPEWLYFMEEFDLFIDSLFINNVVKEEKNDLWNLLLLNSKDHKSYKNSRLNDFLLSSLWGQSVPNVLIGYSDCDAYNYFVGDFSSEKCYQCSDYKCPAGCVATAMGQILFYWLYSTGKNAFFDWWLMKDELIHTTSNQNNYYYEREAIARLLADCGKLVDMDYCHDNKCSSGADDSDVKDVLKDLGFDDDMDFKRRIYHSQSKWEELLIEELNNGRPVLYGGYKTLNPSVGHSFVCDGYNQDDYAGNTFHFNFGWLGVENGFIEQTSIITNGRLDYLG